MSSRTTIPSTPPPNPHAHAQHSSHGSALWASPQFSDYFSDAGEASTDDLRKGQQNSPVQSRILSRLDAIAKKVASSAEHDHDGSQTPYLMDFDSELSALERRLDAPESQTREIAEGSRGAGGGIDLFTDEGEDEREVLFEENEGLRREVRDGREVIARVSKLRESLAGQLVEMKNNFTLATTKLTTADTELDSLRTRYIQTKEENATLHEQNKRLHNDLQTAIPTIFRLKAHLDMLQAEVSSQDPAHELEDSIEHLQNDWADVDRDFEDLCRRYGGASSGKRNGKSGERTDSVIGSGSTPPQEKGSAEGSGSEGEELLHRSRIIIKRGGIIRRINAPSVSEASEGEDIEVVAEASEMGKDDAEEVEGSPMQEHGEVASEQPKTEKATKTAGLKEGPTPWQELWDSIADFAGWHDAYEDS